MIEIIKSEKLTEAGLLRHGFCARTGGQSTGMYESLNVAFDVGDTPTAVANNMRAIQEASGIDMPLVRTKQVHGSTVLEISAIEPSLARDDWATQPEWEGDALICCSNDMTALGIQTADCAPILIADPHKGIVAAVHAGWRGASKGIIRKTVRAMSKLGAHPPSLIACIGPRISFSHYEVGSEVARHFPESAEPIPKKQDKHLLDLGQALEVSLISAGLSTKNIEVLNICSFDDEQRMFSHRRSGVPCGRNLSFIAP